MAKRSLLISIITIFCISVVSCAKGNNVKDKVFTFWIYPQTLECYCLTFYNDNTLQVIAGNYEQNNQGEPISIKKSIEKKEKKLSNENVDKILDLLDEIYINPNIKTDPSSKLNLISDAWTYKLEYKDKIVIQDSMIRTSKEIQNLSNILINESPIKIDIVTKLGVFE